MMCLKPVFLSLSMSLCLMGAISAHADTMTDPIPNALLTVEGQGMEPNQAVTFSTGPKQSLSRAATQQGSISFANLRYTPSDSLSFALSYTVKGGLKSIPNNILITLDPYTGSVNVKGNATRAASIVVSVASEDSNAIIANQDGYFAGGADTLKGFNKGNFSVVASIINVEESCCPRSFKPFNPVTIKITASPEIVPAKKAELPIAKSFDTTQVVMTSPDQRFAVSVPTDLINKSWVSGLHEFANRTMEHTTQQTGSLGSFLEGQNNVAARLSLQKNSAQVSKNYLPSEALCRYGTLSQGLVSSDAISKANKVGLAKALLGSELATSNTAASGQDPLASKIDNFRATNCDKTDGNTALATACKSNTSNERFNRDVDYTRTVDAPLTVPLDLNSSTAGGQDLMSLAENLFPASQQSMGPDNKEYLQNSKSYYSLQAIRSVAKNSFISLLSEKAQGTAGSAQFITALMKAIGIPANQITPMMGEKPSYYAQMEVLTKKVYQDPAFYVNLLDTPTNVARQRTAIRAIKLQQQNDFAAVVKRREMLLAVLLEMKLRENAKKVNQRLSSNPSE